MRTARNKVIAASFALILASAVLGAAAPAAAFWPDEVDEFVAFLNGPDGLEEFGVASARRPHDIVNRIDVVFDAAAPAELRAKSLQAIGRRFMRLVSDRTGISTVTVVERSASGLVLDRAVVKIVGTSGGIPACQDSPAPS